MPFLHRTTTALFMAAGLLAAGSAAATALDKVTVTAAPAGQPSQITVSATDVDETSVCGLRVKFGDGQEIVEKVGSRSHEGFPRTFSHVYAKPGNYQVKVDGKRKGTYFPCVGEAETTASIGGGAAAAAGGALCPQGWAQQGKTRKDGGFACGPAKGAKNPAKPEHPLNCPAGTEYFTKGKALGCEASR